MYEEIQNEFERFKYDINESLVFGRYFDEYNYEDEYSHNEIHKAQATLIHQIKEYLHNNIPNKYVVNSNFCIFVMTIEEAKRRNLRNYSLYIVDWKM